MASVLSSNPRRHAAAHVFVDDLAAPALTPDDAHHLSRVLRLRRGEAVTASDGRGSFRECLFEGGEDGPGLRPVGEAVFEPAAAPPIIVGFALAKGDKPEWSVQKLTEAGVDVIAPFLAARSVVRWDADKAARNTERLARVAREAAMQCRRVWLPEVRPVAAFGDVVAALRAEHVEPALAEPGGQPLSLASPCVLVGPEGGWSGEELAAVPANVSLGSTILRAETATMAAGVLLGALRGGFVQFHDE
jgi:16S rRNA (uracil1498-N3)-methyltransferase